MENDMAEEEQSGDEGTEDENQEGTADDGTENDSADDDNSGTGETVSRTDFDKLFARMQAADRAKTTAEKALREREQKDMSEVDRLKAQLEDATSRADGSDDRLKAMIIENAFHRDNTVTWHDVSDAIAALDLSGVEVGEDGKVKGMAAAIKDVAKRKPHYVKTSSDKDEGEGTTQPAANGASNGRRKGEKGETFDRQKMVNRFPALGK